MAVASKQERWHSDQRVSHFIPGYTTPRVKLFFERDLEPQIDHDAFIGVSVSMYDYTDWEALYEYGCEWVNPTLGGQQH